MRLFCLYDFDLYPWDAYLLAILHDSQASLQFDFIWGLLSSILSAVILLVTLLSSRIETSNDTLHNGHFLLVLYCSLNHSGSI